MELVFFNIGSVLYHLSAIIAGLFLFRKYNLNKPFNLAIFITYYTIGYLISILIMGIYILLYSIFIDSDISPDFTLLSWIFQGMTFFPMSFLPFLVYNIFTQIFMFYKKKKS